MGFGVLEPKDSSVHVAGTVRLDDLHAGNNSSDALVHLKHGTGKDSHIILAPQPSDDPNDPLNWSLSERYLILSIIAFGTIMNAGVLGPLTAAGTVQISIDLGVTVTDIALSSGFYLLTTGATGPFYSALSRKYGKRPVFVASSLFCTIGCIIGETASGYTQFVAARIVQGLGTSAYESISMSSIPDLFCVHQRYFEGRPLRLFHCLLGSNRGSKTAVIQFILAAVGNLASIIAGVITASFGWKYNFHILLPFTALQLLLTFFFVQETTYTKRPSLYNIDTAGSGQDLDQLAREEARKDRHAIRRQEQLHSSEKESSEHDDGTEGRAIQHQISTLSAPPPERIPYMQRLRLYNGVFIHDSLLKMILAFVVCFFNVGIAYNTFMTGIIISFYVAISILSAIIFSPPPYLLSAAGVGYMSTGPLIGGILGFLFVGATSDPLVKFMARKNRGIYEPEFRLPIIAIGGSTAVAGLIGFGYCVQGLKSLYLISFVWGLYLFGLTIIATAVASYTIDAFRDYSTEAFVGNMFFKNFFFYGLTNYIIQWYLTKGAEHVFNISGGITAFLSLLAIPLYFYGKRYRKYWQDHNLVKKFGLETDKTGAE